MFKIIPCMLALAASVSTLSAQEPTFRSQSNVVIVPALVKDGNAKPLYGLTAKDFVVEDDGVEQPAQLDEAADLEPLWLVIAVQNGRAAAAEFERIRTLSTLLDPILGQGQVHAAIVVFDSEVHTLQDFTIDGPLIADDLKGIRAGDGGAVILDAVRHSLKLLEQLPQHRRKALLLLSETRDHGSKSTVEEVVTEIGRSNTLIFALAFSPSLSNVLDSARGKTKEEKDWVDLGTLATRLAVMTGHAMRQNVPKTIADMTGGEYEMFKSHKGFEERMNEFSNHLYIRYMLSFQPKDPHPGLHQITVRLREEKHATVLARTSYWSNPK